jgi:hypothetical protein
MAKGFNFFKTLEVRREDYSDSPYIILFYAQAYLAKLPLWAGLARIPGQQRKERDGDAGKSRRNYDQMPSSFTRIFGKEPGEGKRIWVEK